MPNWKDVLEEIQKGITENAQRSKGAVDQVRRGYLKKLHELTQRNVIAYYSGFLSKPGIAQLEINDEDMNGLMMAVHGMDRTKGLDLILHTPGGHIAATQSIVGYLRKMFDKDMRAIVPQIALSAGTMVACSCKVILMAKHSSLGPIDPQVRNIPAYGVIEEFRRACREVRKDPSRIPIWQQIIGQYRPTYLSQCENAIKWSNEFVAEQLEAVMFDGEKNARARAKRIVKRLTHYTENRTHERHIEAEECEKIGLKISHIEENQELQDLILTVHHCFIHTMTNTNSFKIIENQMGAAFIKQVAIGQP